MFERGGARVPHGAGAVLLPAEPVRVLLQVTLHLRALLRHKHLQQRDNAPELHDENGPAQPASPL